MDLYRRERIFSRNGIRLLDEGPDKINFAGNNYLGLASHPDLIRAAEDSLKKGEISTSASRLISGTRPLHRALEERVALFKGTADAITFTSGYQANISVIPSLAEKNDLIYSDRLNHASLIDGIRLAGCRFFPYEHNNPDHLEDLLRKRPETSGKVMIITDSVFSMDGDIARLRELVALREKHGALLMIDEAHATGVLGEKGHGACEALKIPPDSIDVNMGTFSKAVGTFGAYIAGTHELISWLRNRARGYIYTTAYPPMLAAATMKALDLIESSPHLREGLDEKGQWLRKGLTSAGFDCRPSETQIIPIKVGANETALWFQERLEERGFYLSAIRHPTVPSGTERLRLTLSAEHTQEELEQLLHALIAEGRMLGVID